MSGFPRMLVTAIFALLPSAALAASAQTIAGSGAAGVADGPAALASFVLPAGIAYDSRTKNIYVADAGAQRIRVVSSTLRVTTLAGSGTFDERTLSVAPGYRDGASDRAQFDTPLSVAVDERGDVYVADTGNHAVRKIAGGVVSTIARSSYPTGVAVDKAGNVYVADPVDGLREIQASGESEKIDEPYGPLSIAVREGAIGRTLIVTDARGVLVIDPRGARERYRAFPPGVDTSSASTSDAELVHNIQGDKDIGIPYAVSSLAESSFVYTDIRSSAVQFIDENFTRLQTLGGGYAESSMADSAGMRDGVQSQFNVPMGIAAIDHTSIIVSDSGNRRLRLLRFGPVRSAIYPPAALFPDPPLAAADYKIAFMGNSVIWYNTDWDHSIEGLIEKQLASNGLHHHVRVVPIGGTHFLSLAQAYMQVTPGYYKTVVYVVNIDNACYGCPTRTQAARRNADVWVKRFEKQLGEFKRYLDAQHVGLLVVIHPSAEEITPTEPAQTNLLLPDIAPDLFTLRKLRQAVAGSGVRFIDTTSAFAADYRSAQHLPDFGTEDVHFAPHGRDVLARAVSEELLRALKFR